MLSLLAEPDRQGVLALADHLGDLTEIDTAATLRWFTTLRLRWPSASGTRMRSNKPSLRSIRALNSKLKRSAAGSSLIEKANLLAYLLTSLLTTLDPPLLELPLEHGRSDEHQGNGDNNERHGNPRISPVPEANAGWVLVPFFGSVLLFSARNLFRGKATE